MEYSDLNIENLEQPTIGNLIKEMRLELKLSQEQFASNLGVSFTSINRWENHKTMPSMLALRMLSLYLKQLGERGNQIFKRVLC
ncbi:DNA-binding transcriptional regulator [Picosynechococcus sp. NKBG15041c]|uniref:helix-turn-helix domain-containing protein n=1 Tax=Picosynechococcus sp. NKBG15041c TaxID=1407650 RepID=UPI000463EA3A|nr:helix-turn-helix transcriptional regulator [Picosynechococcus sp. NKBG15041c]